jgi:hypothetical protein
LTQPEEGVGLSIHRVQPELCQRGTMIIQLETVQKANIHLLHETAGGNASSMTKSCREYDTDFVNNKCP